jgi:transposase
MAKIDGRKLDHATSEHLRMHAVRRVREDGEKPSEVMRSMGLCRTTIYRWLRDYDRGGLVALAASKAAGPVCKLTERQARQVRRWIVGKDPRQYGFDFGLWTRRIVIEMVKEKFGVQMGLTAVGKLLARLEITPQRPLRRAYERDPVAVRQWIEQDYPRLRRRAKRAGAKIMFLDEAGFSSEPTLGRTYGLKGQTPVVQTTGQRQKINAISAVSAKGEFWSQMYTGGLNAGRFIGFLKDFRRGRRNKVFLVVDGHPSHRAKLVQKYVQATRGRLELHFLPPYAPDLNPDEFVWQHAKTNGVSKKPLRKNESLKRRVGQDLTAIRANPSLVRSFFGAASVAYAKD